MAEIDEVGDPPATEEATQNQANQNLALKEDDDDEDYEETIVERLIGLTEMFPESVRNGVHKMTSGSFSGAKAFYKFSRSALWIIFSSTAILVAPVALELERSQMEEYSKQQQRQILLGPSAAISPGAGGMMGMPSPIQPVVPPQ